MKINQDVRIGIDQIRKEQHPSAQASARFGQMVVKQDQKLQNEQLTRLLGDISAAGDKIARSRTLLGIGSVKDAG